MAVLDEKIEEMTRKIGVLEDLDRNRKEIQKRFQDGQKENRLKTLALLKVCCCLFILFCRCLPPG